MHKTCGQLLNARHLRTISSCNCRATCASWRMSPKTFETFAIRTTSSILGTSFWRRRSCETLFKMQDIKLEPFSNQRLQNVPDDLTQHSRIALAMQAFVMHVLTTYTSQRCTAQTSSSCSSCTSSRPTYTGEQFLMRFHSATLSRFHYKSSERPKEQ